MVERSGLQVDARLAAFIETEVLAPLKHDPKRFWAGFSALCERFVPRNRDLLAKRDALQAQIDGWHVERKGKPFDAVAYQEFLTQIGYLVADPGDFTIGTQNVDREISVLAGPQLVVPSLNKRFALNAANARWGSLYDAWYGTDALPDAPVAQGKGYDPARGAAVVAAGRAFLDLAIPLEGDGGWATWDGGNWPPLCDPTQDVGRSGRNLIFVNNGLHIEVVIDPSHPVGATDRAGIADIILESALTTIVDLEDSVAAVDAEDKLRAYRNWLGLMRGDLTDTFVKGGITVTRKLAEDKRYIASNDHRLRLPGRSLLFVRNVGHLMSNPAIRLADGHEIPEGIMDAVITSAIGVHDPGVLARSQPPTSLADAESIHQRGGRFDNSREGSIYIVKPKMHGPEEASFTNDLFDAVEDLLELPRHTVKVGVMDEERRTSANLAACIHAVRDRVVFVNTGFLDRTGDEIHTSMQAGAMIRKGAMKQSKWIDAYEKRNVAIALKHGFSGRAQIGKGMWAAPDRMHAMMVEKIAHPRTGANTAWVPSPTAATLHALHYHLVDVFERQREVELLGIPELDELLTVPLADGTNWSEAEVRDELDNNSQGLLGYVVRWIDAGVGCSKVPDINDIGLMEDRATLRISSQHMANWLLHGVCTQDQVMDALKRMAAKVDAQNAGDPGYEPMASNWETSMAFRAACELVFKAVEQPNGYTEPLLHAWRQRKKAAG